MGKVKIKVEVFLNEKKASKAKTQLMNKNGKMAFIPRKGYH